MSRRPPSPVQLNALMARGEHRTAEALVRPWAQSNTASLPLQICWAKALYKMGQAGEAAVVWDHICHRQPIAEHFIALGQALTTAGRPQHALPHLLRAVSSSPQSEEAVDGLLAAAADALDFGPATAALTLLRSLRPQDPRSDTILGRHHLASGRLDLARHHFECALGRTPNHTEAHLQLAAVWTSLGNLAKAAHHALLARQALPDHPEPLRLAALIAGRQGMLDQSRALLDKALVHAPRQPILHWARARQFPRIPDSQTESDAALSKYQSDLQALSQLAQETLPSRSANWEAAVQDAFPVHYTGSDCMEMQRLHGQLVHRVMTAAFPLQSPAPPRRERVRVGFVSGLFRRHTITKLFSRWMTRLDPRRFEVIGYHLGQLEDSTTTTLQSACAAWRDLPGPIAKAVHAVRQDAPDAIIFPELGMDIQPLKLAALRLAPLQAVAWGHPITTGLPTVDLFLACEAMAVQPDRQWTHEARVDLPGIGIDYPRPAPPPMTTREELGLPDRTLVLCVQSLQKYRPAADDLHARVAQAAPEALLVFVGDSSDVLTQRFRNRMSKAFSARGLQLDDHVRILPRMSEANWLRLLSVGDLFLDSPEWSGGNTVLEAVSVDLPCLAWPGDTFRGRHCHGIMGVLDLPELQPADESEWVSRAIALIGDPEARSRLRSTIAARSSALFDDPRSTRALEDLLWARCHK